MADKQDFKTKLSDLMRRQGEALKSANAGDTEGGVTPNTPRKWVELWMKNNGITVDYKERIAWKGRRLATTKTVLATMYDDYFNYARAAKIPSADRFRREDIERAYLLNLQDVQEEELATVLEKVAFSPEVDPELLELSRFVRCIAGDGPGGEFAKTLLLHFIWQVKRKMYGLSTEHHLMTIIKGDQGCGKTEAVGRFLAPVANYVFSAPISVVQDKNELHNFHKNYVFRSEELERLDKTDKNALKRIITEEHVTYRAMYQQATVVAKQNCTFIGTSNDHIADIFVDFTGMRRFAQIDALPVADFKKNWKDINNIQYLKIWQSVDERQPPPILPLIDSGELAVHQESLRAKTQCEQWVEDIGLESGEFLMPAYMLYKSFKLWCNSIGRCPPNMVHFGRELARLGLKSSRKSLEGRKHTVYKCNLDILPNI